MIETESVMIAGDWHCNARWAVHAIREGCSQMTSSPKVILQLGDFGLWRGHQAYLDKLSAALEEQDAELFWIDGNHEDFGLLRKHLEAAENPGTPLIIAPRICYLPRGWRWKWHGREWLALGGAASVDRAFRQEGHSWFREEEITLMQAAFVAMTGTADVMITHECPRKVTNRLVLGEGMPGWDYEVSRKHQEFLEKIIEQVEPRYLYHGHMHIAHESTVTYPYGKLQVRGFGCDGQKQNWAILNTRLMAWEEEIDEHA